MSTAFEIPLSPSAQSFFLRLANTTYRIDMRWSSPSACWLMDFSTEQEAPLLMGLAVVTGADLLAQFAYLGFKGGLIVMTEGDPDAVPTFLNLGIDGNVYFLAE